MGVPSPQAINKDAPPSPPPLKCPGIKVDDGDAENPFQDYYQAGSVEFDGVGGATYVGGDRELCYLGELAGGGPESMLLDSNSDCASIIAAAPTVGGYPYISVDTTVVSAWALPDLSCDTQLVSIAAGSSHTPPRCTCFFFSIPPFRVGPRFQAALKCCHGAVLAVLHAPSIIVILRYRCFLQLPSRN